MKPKIKAFSYPHVMWLLGPLLSLAYFEAMTNGNADAAFAWANILLMWAILFMKDKHIAAVEKTNEEILDLNSQLISICTETQNQFHEIYTRLQKYEPNPLYKQGK
jgi:hypothetical protein